LRIVAALATLLWFALPAAAEVGYTIWTDVDGDTVRARLIGCDAEHVFLSKGGRDYRVPFGLLAAESAAKARRMLDFPPLKSAPAAVAGHSKRAAPPPPPPTVEVGYLRLKAPSAAGATVPPAAAGAARDRHSMPRYGFNVRQRIVRTTAYTSSESDHLIHGNRSALGTPLRYSSQLRSAAADWSVYPVGTLFRITGSAQLYVVDDYGSALVGTGTIDLYQPTMAAMRAWGRRNVEITVVRWGSLNRSAEILSRRTGSAHCRQMLDQIIRKRQ
jgi:3D (Asp-Asp-Asp) domain-containing protein